MQNLGNQIELRSTLPFLRQFLYRYLTPPHLNHLRLRLFRKSMSIYIIIPLVIRDYTRLTDFNRFINYIENLKSKHKHIRRIYNMAIFNNGSKSYFFNLISMDERRYHYDLSFCIIYVIFDMNIFKRNLKMHIHMHCN